MLFDEAHVVAIVAVGVATIEWRCASNIGAMRGNNFRDSFVQATAFANGLPRNAILVSTSFSGTLHFYTGRDVLRYDVVLSPQLDSALDSLRSQGHPIYFIGHDFEADAFKRQFSGSRAAAEFDNGRIPTFEDYVVADLSK